eukprot:g28587.t1
MPMVPPMPQAPPVVQPLPRASAPQQLPPSLSQQVAQGVPSREAASPQSAVRSQRPSAPVGRFEKPVHQNLGYCEDVLDMSGSQEYFSKASAKAKDSAFSLHQTMQGYISGFSSRKPVAPVTQAAAEAIGRIALTTSAWRPVLRSCAMEALTNWIRYGLPDRKLNKYLFWAAAAMSGMPFVANEVKLHMNSVSAVDAALCTIIDILDEDIDGEYTLAGADRGEAEMPDLLGLIVQAMGLHSGAPEIQARGSTCISLLVPYVPFAKLSAVAPVAIVSVLTGHRRFPRRMAKPSAFAQGGRRHQGAEGTEVIVSRLRQEGASECMEQVFMGFSHYEDASELLEERARSALWSGFRDRSNPGGWMNRGIDGAFKNGTRSEGRLDMDFFSGRAAATAIEACERMVLEATRYNESEKEPSDPPIDTTRLHEVASLVSGLCRGRLAALGWLVEILRLSAECTLQVPGISSAALPLMEAEDHGVEESDEGAGIEASGQSRAREVAEALATQLEKKLTGLRHSALQQRHWLRLARELLQTPQRAALEEIQQELRRRRELLEESLKEGTASVCEELQAKLRRLEGPSQVTRGAEGAGIAMPSIRPWGVRDDQPVEAVEVAVTAAVIEANVGTLPAPATAPAAGLEDGEKGA